MQIKTNKYYSYSFFIIFRKTKKDRIKVGRFNGTIFGNGRGRRDRQTSLTPCDGGQRPRGYDRTR